MQQEQETHCDHVHGISIEPQISINRSFNNRKYRPAAWFLSKPAAIFQLTLSVTLCKQAYQITEIHLSIIDWVCYFIAGLKQRNEADHQGQKVNIQKNEEEKKCSDGLHNIKTKVRLKHFSVLKLESDHNETTIHQLISFNAIKHQLGE